MTSSPDSELAAHSSRLKELLEECKAYIGGVDKTLRNAMIERGASSFDVSAISKWRNSAHLRDARRRIRQRTSSEHPFLPNEIAVLLSDSLLLEALSVLEDPSRLAYNLKYTISISGSPGAWQVVTENEAARVYPNTNEIFASFCSTPAFCMCAVKAHRQRDGGLPTLLCSPTPDLPASLKVLVKAADIAAQVWVPEWLSSVVKPHEVIQASTKG